MIFIQHQNFPHTFRQIHNSSRSSRRVSSYIKIVHFCRRTKKESVLIKTQNKVTKNFSTINDVDRQTDGGSEWPTVVFFALHRSGDPERATKEPATVRARHRVFKTAQLDAVNCANNSDGIIMSREINPGVRFRRVADAASRSTRY